MSKQSFLARLNWIEGRPPGVVIPESTGPVLYQDKEGDIYCLNELEPIPRGLKRWAKLFDHNLAKPSRKNGNGNKPTLTPAQRDELYQEWVTGYIEFHPNTQKLPRDRAYRSQRADFIQMSNLISQRGAEWVKEIWSEAVKKYFHPERFQGIRTLADMCKRIDVVLSWEPQRANGRTCVAEAKGRKR